MRLEDLSDEEIMAVHCQIYRYLRSLGASHETAEDITQDIVVENIGREIEHVGFLLRCARNRYLDWIKLKDNQCLPDNGTGQDGKERSNANDKDPSQRVENIELAAMGMAATTPHCRLPNKCRHVCRLIVWLDIEERTLHEVSVMTREPLENVRRWHKQCQDRFRRGVEA